jgi:hypothetical protein
MPGNLLLGLEKDAPVAANLEALERGGSALEELRRVYGNQVGLIVEIMRGLASTFEQNWQAIVRAVAKGQTAEMQAARPTLLEAFARRLDLLKRAHALAARFRQSYGAEVVPDPDILLPEIAAMERLRVKVFDRWQTVDDLEDLAGRDYPLTTADLDRIGPQRRPPEAYYAEENKSF